MNTNALKIFAQETRRKLMQQVAAKLEFVLTGDSPELRERKEQVKKLKEEIKKTSKEQVVDKVAYTWFNRLVALRFMDANDYQPLGLRVISPLPGQSTPELLNQVKQGDVPKELNADTQQLLDILDGRTPSSNPQNEVFKAVLIGACNHLNSVLPFLFERINDYTELLLPDDLTSDFSVVSEVVQGMSEEDCSEVEIIGWLYQFYISELNDSLISAKKKYSKTELAPASQLFTPKWIVQYMVDNTLGQVWTEINPNSKLTDTLDFYIKPSYLDNIEKRKKKSIEEITFFEPCAGSGHILSYAFDVFYKIYEEEGYNPSEIPKLIITKNLFGVDIDERAAQIASFVLIMKGREKYRRFLRSVQKENIEPNITYYQDFEFDHKFENATAIGSLIRVEPKEVEAFSLEKDSIFAERQEELYKLYQLLGKRYDCVVTNPPYIGSKRMESSLKEYVEETYPATKSDLFASFILRCLELCNDNGLSGYMTPFVWMFISSYEKLRLEIIDNHFINNLIQLEYSGFDGATVPICTFTLRNQKTNEGLGSYIRLSDFKGAVNQAPKTLEAIQNPTCGWFYTANQNDFEKIPESRCGYWLTKEQINAFFSEKSLKEIYPPKAGLSTANNDRFLRYWTEIDLIKFDFSCLRREDLKFSKKWLPMTKGGRFRKWFGNTEYVLNWENDGEELKYWLVNNPKDKSTKSWSRYIRNYKSYCLEGFSFSDVSSGNPAFRKQGTGFIPNSRGPFIYSVKLELLGFLNSKVCVSFLKLLSPTLTFNVGDIAKLPFLQITSDEISNLTYKSIVISETEWNSRETSWDFEQNELLRIQGQDLEEAFESYCQFWQNKFYTLHKNEEGLNKQFIEIYGLKEELTPDVALTDVTILKDELVQKEVKALSETFKSGWELVDQKWQLKNEAYNKPKLPFDGKEIMQQFISYAVGCMFGRYSLDETGLILANQGETLEDYLKKVYNSDTEPVEVFLPDDDNIIPILDDEWFEDDIVGQFNVFLKASFGEKEFNKNLAFVEEKVGEIRKYLVKSFYADHIKRYKKRPIYWQFSSPKGHFNVLVYMHRYNKDIIHIILNNYLREFIEKLKSQKEQLVEIQISGSATAQTKAKKEEQQIDKMLLDGQEYEREILYKLAMDPVEIDLDDGVLVNYNKFGNALKEVKGLNDKKKKAAVKKFDWIDSDLIK